MKKMNKTTVRRSISTLKFLLWRRRITNIALIFTIIGVFLGQDIAYSLDMSHLRPPLLFGNKERRWDVTLRYFLSKGQYPFDYEASMLLHNFEYVRRMIKGEMVMPPEIEIHPSSRCNKGCTKCIGADGRGVMGLLLDRDTLIKLIEDMHTYNLRQVDPGLHIKRALFTGIRGEPLFNPATPEVMQKAIDYGFEVGLVTNGILLTDKVRQVIVKGKFIQISLDAATPETFSRQSLASPDVFYNVVGNVRELVKLKHENGGNSNLEIGLSFVITRETYKEIPSFIRLAKELGANYARLRAPEGRITGTISEAQWQEIYGYLEELKNLEDKNFKILLTDATEKGLFTPDFKSCPAHALLGFVGPDHNVYPCTNVRHSAEMSFGSLKEKSFQDIWEGPARKKFIQEFNPSEMCLNCLTGQSRLNRFLIFLMQEGSKDPDFLPWLNRWIEDFKRPEDLDRLAEEEKVLGTVDNYQAVLYKLPKRREKEGYRRLIVIYDTKTKTVPEWFNHVIETYAEPEVSCYDDNHLLEIEYNDGYYGAMGQVLSVLDTKTGMEIFHMKAAEVAVSDSSNYYIVSHFTGHNEFKIYDLKKRKLTASIKGKSCQLIGDRFLSVSEEHTVLPRTLIYDLLTIKGTYPREVLSFGEEVLEWKIKGDDKIICTKEDGKGFKYTELYNLATGEMEKERTVFHKNRVSKDCYTLPSEKFGGNNVNLIDVLLDVLKQELGYIPLVSVTGSLSYAFNEQGALDWGVIDDVDIRIHTKEPLSVEKYNSIEISYLEALKERGISVSLDPRAIYEKDGIDHTISLANRSITSLFTGNMFLYSLDAYRMTDMFFGDLSPLAQYEPQLLIKRTMEYYEFLVNFISFKSKIKDKDTVVKNLKSLYQLAYIRGRENEFRWLLKAFKKLEIQQGIDYTGETFELAEKAYNILKDTEHLETDLQKVAGSITLPVGSKETAAEFEKLVGKEGLYNGDPEKAAIAAISLADMPYQAIRFCVDRIVNLLTKECGIMNSDATRAFTSAIILSKYPFSARLSAGEIISVRRVLQSEVGLKSGIPARVSAAKIALESGELPPLEDSPIREILEIPPGLSMHGKQFLNQAPDALAQRNLIDLVSKEAKEVETVESLKGSCIMNALLAWRIRRNPDLEIDFVKKSIESGIHYYLLVTLRTDRKTFIVDIFSPEYVTEYIESGHVKVLVLPVNEAAQFSKWYRDYNLCDKKDLQFLSRLIKKDLLVKSARSVEESL